MMNRPRPPRTRPCAVLVSVTAALSLTACGIFGLSAEERDELATYQQRAQLYYEGGNFNQSLSMVERGMRLDPENYKLRFIRAMVFLRTRDQRLENLDRAEDYFEDLFPERPLSTHSPQFLLGYAWMSEALALREQRQAQEARTVLETLSTGDFEAEAKRAQLAEHENRANALLLRTKSVLEQLVTKGEEVMLAEKTLMQVHASMGNADDAVRHGEEYLTAAKREEERIQQRLRDQQTTVDQERILRTDLIEHRNTVSSVKEYLAALDYQRGQYSEAVRRLDEVLTLDPHKSEHYYNRAEALQQMGETGRAREDYQTFLVKTQLAVGNVKVQKARAAVRDLLP